MKKSRFTRSLYFIWWCYLWQRKAANMFLFRQDNLQFGSLENGKLLNVADRIWCDYVWIKHQVHV